MYLFGFGSLINLSSAQKSFERKLSQNDLIPIKIKGYKKVWNSIENIDFEDMKNANGIFLNLQEDKDKIALGVVIKITDKELELLKLREKNYSCITIKKENILNNSNIDEDLIAFMTTNEEKIAKVGCHNCYIPAKYIDLVRTALNNYSANYRKEFEEETFSNYPFLLKEGTYNFSDPIQNKFAKEGVEK
jgi:hypothetical protein